MDDLLPCPFCGGKAVTETTITEASVRCWMCKANIVRSHADYSSHGGLEAAATVWNLRHPPPPRRSDAMERYHYYPGEGLMENETGDWVRYDDHAAAIAALEAEVERLRALAIERDGGTHDTDCTARMALGRPCTCGHAEIAALTAS